MTEPARLTEMHRAIVAAQDEHPNWFRLPSDEPATPGDVVAAADALGCALPESYRMFVSEFGGGDFAFVEIYSATPDSEVSIVEMNQRPWLSGLSFVAFADTGTGDYYGWRVVDGEALDDVVILDHTTGQLRECDFVDFVDFVVREGLRL